MSSSQPSEFDKVLKSLKEYKAQLDLAALSLMVLQAESDAYEKNDPRRLPALKALMDTRLDLARQYCTLAMVKAKYGLVGDSWYKDDGKEEPNLD